MCGEMASTCPIHCASPVCKCGGVWVGVCICTCCSVEAFTCVCVRTHSYIQYFLLPCISFVCISTHTHTHTCVYVHTHVLCADWAGVLAIRKTTSGKVHINHVPQLKERNGAEMSGGRKWRRRKNNESLSLRYSELLHNTVCSDMMLEAFMNKQGHDNRLKPSGQSVAAVPPSAPSVGIISAEQCVILKLFLLQCMG